MINIVFDHYAINIRKELSIATKWSNEKKAPYKYCVRSLVLASLS